MFTNIQRFLVASINVLFDLQFLISCLCLLIGYPKKVWKRQRKEEEDERTVNREKEKRGGKEESESTHMGLSKEMKRPFLCSGCQVYILFVFSKFV